MADPIAPIPVSLPPVEAPGGRAAARPAPGPASGFADTLRGVIAEVTESQRAADAAARDFATGKTTDVAATMIEMEKASVSFALMLQVRNRLLEAYQEIQRIQV